MSWLRLIAIVLRVFWVKYWHLQWCITIDLSTPQYRFSWVPLLESLCQLMNKVLRTFEKNIFQVWFPFCTKKKLVQSAETSVCDAVWCIYNALMHGNENSKFQCTRVWWNHFVLWENTILFEYPNFAKNELKIFWFSLKRFLMNAVVANALQKFSLAKLKNTL